MNPAFHTDLDSRFSFPLYQARYNLLRAALTERGLDPDRYSMLAPDCTATWNHVFECRKAEFVEFLLEALALGADPDTLPDPASCDVFIVTGVQIVPSETVPTVFGTVATGTATQTINRPFMVINIPLGSNTATINNSLAKVGMYARANPVKVDTTAKSAVAVVSSDGHITVTTNANTTAILPVLVELLSIEG